MPRAVHSSSKGLPADYQSYSCNCSSSHHAGCNVSTDNCFAVFNDHRSCNTNDEDFDAVSRRPPHSSHRRRAQNARNPNDARQKEFVLQATTEHMEETNTNKNLRDARLYAPVKTTKKPVPPTAPLTRMSKELMKEQNDFHSKNIMLRYGPIYTARMGAEYDAIGNGSRSLNLKRQMEMVDNAVITTTMVPGREEMPKFRANVDTRLVGHMESLRCSNPNSSHMNWSRARSATERPTIRVKQLAFLRPNTDEEITMEE